MLPSIFLLKILLFSGIYNIDYKNISLNHQTEKNIIDKYFINKIDFLSDSKITKFVDNKTHFNKLDYEPKNLEPIKWDYLFDSKWDSKIRKDANLELINMSKGFFNKFSEKIVIVSAYRSYDYQLKIKEWWCLDTFCAKPWYSEHQTWLAVDLWEASDKESWKKSKKFQEYYIWLDKNAYKYWFINTYKKWTLIDWYEIEPWHWRYVWVAISTYLKNYDLTFAEIFYRK